MLNFLNRNKIKQAITNSKAQSPREWRSLCINKIRSGYGGAYPQFNTIDQLENALIQTKWLKQDEVFLPPNIELYTSELQGQIEYVRIDELSCDTLFYANVNRETNELDVIVKGVNPGKSLNSYILIERRGKNSFVKSFSTGNFFIRREVTKHSYNTGDILTKREVINLHLEWARIEKISLTFNNKVVEGIRQSKKHYPEIWIEGCKDIMQKSYNNFKTVKDFEHHLTNARWDLVKRNGKLNILRYVSRDLTGVAETRRITEIADSTELIFKRANPEDEFSDGYIVAIGETPKNSNITIIDVMTMNDKLIIGSIFCGTPVTLLNKSTARYRHNERISKIDAIELGFQYVLI